MKHGTSDYEIKVGWVNSVTGEEGAFNKDGTTRKFKWWEKIRNWYECHLEHNHLHNLVYEEQIRLDNEAWRYYGTVGSTWGECSIYINDRLQKAFAQGPMGKIVIDYNPLKIHRRVVKL